MVIDRLHEKLLVEGIPHEFFDRSENSVHNKQIIYPSREKAIGDFIQVYRVFNTGEKLSMSYGGAEDLMEAMGFGITEEIDGDTVKGFIGLDEAYQMIKDAEAKRAMESKTDPM